MTTPSNAELREAIADILYPNTHLPKELLAKTNSDGPINQLVELFQAREQQLIDTVVKYSNALELEWRNYRGSSNYADFAKEFYAERLQNKTNDGGN